MTEDQDLLLAVLNSTPTVHGAAIDELEGAAGRALAQRFGGIDSSAQLSHLRRVRDALQRMIHEEPGAADDLNAMLGDAVLTPTTNPDGLDWQLRTHPDQELGARAIIAWSETLSRFPGRLRACANEECTLFLIDHSRPGTARWCSMSTCGNRMKARAHASRRRESGQTHR